MRDTIVYFGKKVCKKQFFILVILYLFTFYLWFGYNPILEFRSSDDAFVSFFTLTMLKRHVISLPLSGSLVAGLFSYGHGSYPIFLLFYVKILNFLRIPLTPFILKLPACLIASTTPLLVFFIMRLFCAKTKALLVSFFITIWPFSVLFSRYMNGHIIIFESSFFLLSIIFLLKYLDTKSKKDLYFFSCIIALYLNLSVMSLTFVPVIFYSLFTFDTNTKQKLISRVREFFKKISQKGLWFIPTVTLIPHFLAFLYGKIFIGKKAVTYFGKLLSRTNSSYYFDVNYFINFYIINHLGIIFAIFLLCGIFYGIYTAIVRSKESIFFVGALCFILPFGFILGIKEYPGWAYLSDGLYCLTFLSFLFLSKIFQHKKIIAFWITLILNLYALSGILSIFNPNNIWLKKVKPGCDYIYFNSSGQTSAGYYVRENIALEKKIFTDMEPIYANYYFGRNGLFNLYDADLKQNIRYFKKVKEKIDYAIVSSATAEYYEFEKDGYYKAAEIYEENRPLISIFSHKKTDKINIFNNNDLIKNFYRKYANIQNIVPYRMDHLQNTKE